MADTVYGWWVIRERDTDVESGRIASHFPPFSSQFCRAESGLFQKVDFDRYWVKWVPAPEADR